MSKKLIKLAELPPNPHFELERDLIAQSSGPVCGLDEVGRGPLAGPVVAAAVILDSEHIPEGIQDSKKLSEKKREALFMALLDVAQISVVSLPAREIDEINILQASLLSLSRAASLLPICPSHALVDGRHVPQDMPCPATAVIKGDQISLSIAAASIVAKVMRDRMMKRLDNFHPAYGFGKHKGYGTRAHLEALEKYGSLQAHRLSFAPLKDKA